VSCPLKTHKFLYIIFSPLSSADSLRTTISSAVRSLISAMAGDSARDQAAGRTGVAATRWELVAGADAADAQAAIEETLLGVTRAAGKAEHVGKKETSAPVEQGALTGRQQLAERAQTAVSLDVAIAAADALREAGFTTGSAAAASADPDIAAAARDMARGVAAADGPAVRRSALALKKKKI
jgi:hypothetical protein